MNESFTDRFGFVFALVAFVGVGGAATVLAAPWLFVLVPAAIVLAVLGLVALPFMLLRLGWVAASSLVCAARRRAQSGKHWAERPAAQG